MNSNLQKLSIHTITHKPWTGAQCIRHYAAAGVGGITFWRYNFAEQPATALGKMAREEGLTVTALARGGFFPSVDAEGRAHALDDNLRAIEQAHDCGAPVLVLVCGAVPGIPLIDARKQIADGIAALLDAARAAQVKLAIEPLHPMYADTRSAIITMGQANQLCAALGNPPEVGIAMDVYHTWWDDRLPAEIAEAGNHGRLFSFHICDWRTPTEDLLNDRAIMGEGCIPLANIHANMAAAGFSGFHEVEIFSTRHWAENQEDYLQRICQAYQNLTLTSPHPN